MQTQTAIDSAKTVAENVVQSQDLISRLQTVMQPVADKIGQGAQFGWDTVVQQQIVWGYVHAFFALSSIASIISLIFIFKKLKSVWDKKDKYDRESYTMGMVFSIMGIVLLMFLFEYNAVNAITHLLNPNYYAIDFFIQLVTPVTKN